VKRYWQDDAGEMHQIDVEDDAVPLSVGWLCPCCVPNNYVETPERDARRVVKIVGDVYTCAAPRRTDFREHPRPTKAFYISGGEVKYDRRQVAAAVDP
jgi:hypothetical protein